MTYCTLCGFDPNNELEVRKHIVSEHYDYLLGQCKGNKELLKKWADMKC